MKIVLTDEEKWLHLVISKEAKEKIQELAKSKGLSQAKVIESLVEKKKG